MNTSTFIGQAGSFKVVTRKMNLTAQAGVVLLRDFVGKFAFNDLIDASINVKERERGYPESENILALCWNLILGGASLRDLDVLRGDGGICRLLEVESILAPTTAGEFLRSFDIGDITRLQTLLRAAATRVRPHQQSETVTIDLDPSLYRQCSTRKQGSRDELQRADRVLSDICVLGGNAGNTVFAFVGGQSAGGEQDRLVYETGDEKCAGGQPGVSASR